MPDRDQPRSKRTILAVDDAPENLDVIKSILVPDFTVKAATSGAQALKIAQSQPPDLILLDITMSDMDGYEVCRHLKTLAATRDVPVIFVTARDQSEDEARGLEMGAVDYITKPIQPPILRARIRTHLALADAIQTVTLQNKALIDAAKLREDVDNITRHDLKSPLNVIIGVPQLLLMQCDFTDHQREFVKLVEESGYRMLDMINRSLDLYKMENGTYEFEPQPVDLLAVMKGVLSELHPLIAAQALRIDMLVDGAPADEDQPVEVLAEPLLCHSMFSNLCKNAIEASPRGDTITIGITRGPSVEVAPAVEIALENGGAVPERIRGRFFQKFATAGKPNGTGLGAYSALLNAKTQKCSIALDTSIPGRTRILVTLPPA